MIEIKHGDATLVDPQGGVRRSLCVANVSCASFSVDADEADGLHEAALRALIAGGFEIDEDIGALPIVQRLLSGPLAAELAAVEGVGRRLTSESTAPPLCTNTCTHASDGACQDGVDGDALAIGLGTDFFCALGTDCADCNERAEYTLRYMSHFFESNLHKVNRIGSAGLTCPVGGDPNQFCSNGVTGCALSIEGQASRSVPTYSFFHPYFTSCSVNLDSSTKRGAATFTLDPTWASYDLASVGANVLPTSVWMTYTEHFDDSPGFDGGTVLERFCPTDINYQGPCRIRYTYADDRGLVGITGAGIFGQTEFDLTWSCTTTAGLGRVCTILAGKAAYVAQASSGDTDAASIRVGGDSGYKFQRRWEVPLATDGAGSVKLPAFRACVRQEFAGIRDCSCVSFPRLVWDVRPSADGGQQWNEEGDGCSDSDAQEVAVDACNGRDTTREPLEFSHATYADRNANLANGILYAWYQHLPRNPEEWGGAAKQVQLDEMWATLGIFQRKYAPWLNFECAQSGSEGVVFVRYEEGVTNSYDWPNVFDDSDSSFDYIAFAAQRDVPSAPNMPSPEPSLSGSNTSTDVSSTSTTCVNRCDTPFSTGFNISLSCDDYAQLATSIPSADAVTCSVLTTYGCDCTGCSCPLDQDAGRRRAQLVEVAPDSPEPSLEPSEAPEGSCFWPPGGFTDAAVGVELDPITGLPVPVSRRELGRGVGRGSAGSGRLQGCARHATCATRGSRAPPRRP